MCENSMLSSCGSSFMSMQDKSPIIEELRTLVQEKDIDLQRYKAKYEDVLDRCNKLQKKLDSHLSTSRSIAGTSNGQLLRTTADSNCEVASRAMGDSPTSGRAVEHSEVSSFTPDINRLAQGSIRSMPASTLLSIGGQPGMSAALLHKLIQENLRLRKQVEVKQPGRPAKIPEEAENIISDLKMKLEKREAELQDLRSNATRFVSVTEKPNYLPEVNLEKENLELRNKLEKCEKNVGLFNDLVDMLKQQNTTAQKDNEDLRKLVSQLKSQDVIAVNSQLKSELQELQSRHESLSKQCEVQKDTCSRLQNELDETRRDRDRILQNYNVLVATNQSHERTRPPASYSSYMPVTTYIQPQPCSQQSYHMATSPVATSMMAPLSTFSSNTTPPPLPSREREPPIPPRNRYATGPVSQPRERKSFKCPKCEIVFDSIDEYKHHIKQCLKR